MDANVNAAHHTITAQIASAEASCRRTALRYGKTADEADNCDDGDVGCPACPFQNQASGYSTEIPDLSGIEGISYDRHGRLNYHPLVHTRQAEPWLSRDEAFLIENYERLGPEVVSFALKRTIHTVMTYAYRLRKLGRMPKRKAGTRHHKRQYSLAQRNQNGN